MTILKEEISRAIELMGILSEQEYIRFNKPNKKGIDIYVKAEDKGKDLENVQTYIKSDSGEFIPVTHQKDYSDEDKRKLAELRAEMKKNNPFLNPDRDEELTNEITKIRAKYVNIKESLEERMGESTPFISKLKK